MTRLLAFAALVALTGCSKEKPFSVEKPLAGTKRTTKLGEVIGGEGRYDSYVWLGIPFAEAPVGELRWRAPKPAKPWSPALEATKFKEPCAQPNNELAGGAATVNSGIAGSEDCLYLNVWAPKKDAGKLPVMVWIHGGGNSIGSAQTYELGHLATSQKLVMVSVQYRLGPLGWFRHPALRGDSPEDESGNYGTLDLIAALEWVRDNIDAFGGDPSNVTVFGESAGAQNTYSLLLSPKAKGLFHRAIAQSPVTSRHTLEAAETTHKNSSANVVSRLAGSQDAADLAAFLRKQPLSDLFAAYTGEERGLKMLDMPVVIPDGTVLPANGWLEQFATPGGWNQMPVITGSNKDEAKLFLFLNPKYTKKLFGVAPRMRDESRYEAAAEVFSALWRTQMVNSVAHAMKSSGATEVWSYRFDYDELPTKVGADLSKMLGAAHGFEIPFAHGHLGGVLKELMGDEGSADRETLTTAMMSYWGSFARDGKPTPAKGQPEWPVWSQTLILDAAPAGIRAESKVQTTEEVLAAAMKDPRVPEEKERCAGLKGLAAAGFISAEQFQSIAGCRE